MMTRSKRFWQSPRASHVADFNTFMTLPKRSQCVREETHLTRRALLDWMGSRMQWKWCVKCTQDFDVFSSLTYSWYNVHCIVYACVSRLVFTSGVCYIHIHILYRHLVDVVVFSPRSAESAWSWQLSGMKRRGTMTPRKRRSYWLLKGFSRSSKTSLMKTAMCLEWTPSLPALTGW